MLGRKLWTEVSWFPANAMEGEARLRVLDEQVGRYAD
jgi:hypothetical protein